jgi:hypothetical protein
MRRESDEGMPRLFFRTYYFLIFATVCLENSLLISVPYRFCYRPPLKLIIEAV